MSPAPDAAILSSPPSVDLSRPIAMPEPGPTPATPSIIDVILAELERLPSYTVRADRSDVYSDTTGQWVMFGDVKRLIEKHRAPR